MWIFSLGSVLGAGLVFFAALRAYGRRLATFVSVLLGIQLAVSLGLAHEFSAVLPLYGLGQALAFAQLLAMTRPGPRPSVWRWLVSVPGSFFYAGTFLAFPWAVLHLLGLHPPAPWLPYLVAFGGVLQSVSHWSEEVDLSLSDEMVTELKRHPRGSLRVERPLRIVQITDPHLGAFMSEDRLRRLCERAVARDPDLVLLTGDYLTMETHHAEDALARALAPLASLPGRVFACRGNHDHEAPETVARALQRVGARLLIDEAVTVATAAGPVQVLGLDFHFRGREQREACARFPRVDGALRVVLLHDPGAFRLLADGDGDLVFSGHTHGGQVGLLSLGLVHTVVSALGVMPDHGFWALGRNRLYVHRGSGHYGFPLRIGVPTEDSLVRVHAP